MDVLLSSVGEQTLNWAAVRGGTTELLGTPLMQHGAYSGWLANGRVGKEVNWTQKNDGLLENDVMWRHQKLNARSLSFGNSHADRRLHGNSVIYKSPSPPKAVTHSPFVRYQQIRHGVLERVKWIHGIWCPGDSWNGASAIIDQRIPQGGENGPLYGSSLAAKVSMSMQLRFFTFRSRVRPEVRLIPDAFLLNSRGCGFDRNDSISARTRCLYIFILISSGISFSDALVLGSVLLLTGKSTEWLLACSIPTTRRGSSTPVLCQLHHQCSASLYWVIPTLGRTIKQSGEMDFMILRTNKKHSKGGALHILSVLQRAARTPLRPVKQYSQYDYEGREETFGFVPMSTMAEDTSEAESAGVLPIPSFHAVINFLDGRTGNEREALRTGILTTSLAGGFLLTGNGKGKTQVTVPRRASRLSFLSRRSSPTPPTAAGEEAEYGAEERCAHAIHVIPPSSTLSSKTVQNLEHFLINHSRTAASTSSLPTPISATKSATHYAYIIPFNLLSSSHGPSILDFALAGALDGGGSKAWIRSMHDVRVTGGSVKMLGSGLPTPPDSEEELGGVKGGYQLSDSPPLDAEEEREKTLRALEKGKGRAMVGSTFGKNPVRYSQPLTRGGSIRLSRSDGTGENTRRPTSRDRRRSDRSKPEHGHSQSRSKSDHGHRSTRLTVSTTPLRAQTVSSKHTSQTTKPLRSPSITKPIPPRTVPSVPRSPTVAQPHPVHHTHAHARTPSDTHVSQALPSLPTPRNTPPITMKSNATWNGREKPLPRFLRRKEGKLDVMQRASWFLSFWSKD
ncbi:hypothetical protein EDD85DRAFT_795376 [Armillaria nabsnona]|nr:hypothetical protein EDD85DRAFT_795376 [Armillaria nabsnona]